MVCSSQFYTVTLTVSVYIGLFTTADSRESRVNSLEIHGLQLKFDVQCSDTACSATRESPAPCVVEAVPDSDLGDWYIRVTHPDATFGYIGLMKVSTLSDPSGRTSVNYAQCMNETTQGVPTAPGTCVANFSQVADNKPVSVGSSPAEYFFKVTPRDHNSHKTIADLKACLYIKVDEFEPLSFTNLSLHVSDNETHVLLELTNAVTGFPSAFFYQIRLNYSSGGNENGRILDSRNASLSLQGAYLVASKSDIPADSELIFEASRSIDDTISTSIYKPKYVSAAAPSSSGSQSAGEHWWIPLICTVVVTIAILAVVVLLVRVNVINLPYIRRIICPCLKQLNNPPPTVMCHFTPSASEESNGGNSTLSIGRHSGSPLPTGNGVHHLYVVVPDADSSMLEYDSYRPPDTRDYHTLNAIHVTPEPDSGSLSLDELNLEDDRGEDDQPPPANNPHESNEPSPPITQELNSSLSPDGPPPPIPIPSPPSADSAPPPPLPRSAPFIAQPASSDTQTQPETTEPIQEENDQPSVANEQGQPSAATHKSDPVMTFFKPEQPFVTQQEEGDKES